LYKAKIIRVTNLQKHPNADKLQLLDYNNMRFVVGLDIAIGDIVILFPVDGKLSHDMLRNNNLYRDAAKNVDPLKAGFFEDNGKIRTQKFRGELSQGFVIGLRGVEWATSNWQKLEVGLEFTEINGHVICEKYMTPATIAANRNAKSKTKKSNNVERYIQKHYDTEQLAYNLDKLPSSGLVIVTEKVHGTSGYTGYVKVETQHHTWFKTAVNNLFKRAVLKPKVTSTYDYVTCTRNTVCNDREDCTNPEGSEYYRWQYHNKFVGTLRKGETVYYEICGYTHTGKPIMNQQNTESLKDKSFLSQFGKTMTYSYGCNPETKPNDMYVYRITMQNDSGDVTELSWFQVERRCAELGLKTVPVLLIDYYSHYEYGEIVSTLADRVSSLVKNEYLVNGPSTIDSRHLMEGVCTRIESDKGIKVYKQKNQTFLVLEGVAKESDSYIDTEEIN